MKTAVLSFLIATAAFAEEQFVTYRISHQEAGKAITLIAEPLAHGPVQVLPQSINLLGEGMVFSSEKQTHVSVIAWYLHRSAPISITEKERGKDATAFVLQTLDEQIAPVFTNIAERAEQAHQRKKQKLLERAQKLSGKDVHGVSWIAPTGYALAEKIMITLSGEQPSSILLFYEQNLRGKIYLREKKISFSTIEQCLTQQKNLETVLMENKLFSHGQITGENSTEPGGYLGWLQFNDFLPKSIPVAVGCYYFSSADGQVWCSEHTLLSISPETIKKKCAWQQKHLTLFLDIYYSATRRFPDLSKEAEKQEFAERVGCINFLREPTGSQYLNRYNDTWCERHGRLR